MITLEQIIRTLNYTITSGKKSTDDRYGADAFVLQYESTNYVISIIFDLKTNDIYEITLNSSTKNLYKTLNSKYSVQTSNLDAVELSNYEFMSIIEFILKPSKIDITLGDYINRVKK